MLKISWSTFKETPGFQVSLQTTLIEPKRARCVCSVKSKSNLTIVVGGFLEKGLCVS